MKALALLLAGVLPAAASAPRIGAAGAVSGGVVASGASKRTLKSGSEVFHKDSVTTDAKGRLQVLLLDQTVFTVGPDSQIVLDEFVYDPFTDAGKVTAQVTKGVFRFVTGKVAGKKPADMKIKIPSGTIGIRGTFGAGSVDSNGDALIGLLGPGPDNNGDERVGGLDIDTGKDTQSLDEPGTGVIVKADGDVSPPFTLTPEQTASLNAGGSGEDSGGSGTSGSSGGSSGGSEEGGDEDASSTAGQDTAQAGESSTAAGDVGDTASDLGEDTNTAAQNTAVLGRVLDGVARWDDLRTLPSGQAHFNGSGIWNLTTCGGGSCAGSSAGSLSFSMNIDFGAQTVGGLGSSISASDNDTAGGGVNVSQSITIPTTSWGADGADATLTFSDVPTTGVTNTAVISLNNSGGNPATSATASFTYQDTSGNHAGSGSLTAPRFDGLIPQ